MLVQKCSKRLEPKMQKRKRKSDVDVDFNHFGH